VDKVKKIVDQIIDLSHSKGKTTVFLIGNTAKIEDVDFYLIPVRSYSQIVVAGAIVFSELTAKNIVKTIDGLVDYIFVDSEKKISDKYSINKAPSNIERAVKETVVDSQLISYKANDLTVDAADSFIAEYFLTDISGIGGKKTAIIGAGNVGSKIGMKLVERGSDVTLYRRDVKKLDLIVDYINSTKSKYTVARAYGSHSALEASNKADILIGSASGVAVINEEIISSIDDKTLIVDAGKGSIGRDALLLAHSRKIEVYRLSVESAIEGMVLSLISTHNSFNNLVGRDIFDGVKVVSGGLIAGENEFVVDNYSNPKIIYGLGNGMGDFNRKLNKEMLDALNKLDNFINGNHDT